MITWFKNPYIKIVGIVFLVLVTFLLILNGWQSLVQSLRMIFGTIFIFFLPGFFFTWTFFPETKTLQDIQSSAKIKTLDKALDWLQRIILSVFFSIIAVILPLVVIRYFDMPLTSFLVGLIIFIINLLGITAVLITFWRRKE